MAQEVYEIKKESCPKCNGDIKWTVSFWDEEQTRKAGYSLAQCQNPDCKIVTHTGDKLCQMNNCEWHEICANCGKEICGDHAVNENDKPIHLNEKDEHKYGEPSCEEATPREFSFFG